MPKDKKIPLAQLTEPPDAMRYDMDDEKMSQLVESIKRVGILEPLLVVADDLREGNGEQPEGGDSKEPGAVILHRYQVRAGHRRLLAARVLNLESAPCRVFGPGEADALQLMIDENICREEVTPFEEGCLYAKIIEEPGIAEEEIQRRIGKSLPYIYSRYELVKGDPEIALAVHRGQIPLGVARKLNQVRYPAPGMHGEQLAGEQLQNAIASADAYRAMFLERALAAGCSISQADMWVSQWRQAAGVVVTSARPALEPTPEGGFPAAEFRCALCGEIGEGHEMEGIYVHREELAAYRVARAQQSKGE